MENNKQLQRQPIIFTDLDGTLLDHDNYSFEAASAALALISQLKIPLIINSSKTYSEIIDLQNKMGITQPFICENGAAAYWRDGDNRHWYSHSFTSSRERVLDVLTSLRKNIGFDFKGFNDFSIKDICQLTGLNTCDARLAAERNYSEPLTWLDSNENLIKFKKELSDKGLVAHQGGRFLTVMGQSNKAKAMLWMSDKLWSKKQKIIIALGDSPNDSEMLSSAHIAVIIKSAKSENILIDEFEDKNKKIIRTKLAGPAGWQCAMNEILPQFKN
jgi:mannosyl-3-phosphoglycerate phosphatase